MILSNLSRQQSALRICRASVEPQCRLYNPKSQRRRLHNLPQLIYHQHFTHHGINDLLTPSSYTYAWTEYQSYILSRLNLITSGTPLESALTKNILINSARDPSQASLFNHASMAWNNHQFFSTLSPDPTPMSTHLSRMLSESFSSPEDLRQTFIATANAMFGPGFVWLVKRRDHSLTTSSSEPLFAILTTYLAGSPLPGAHYRKQEQDSNTALRAGSHGPLSGMGPKIAPGGANVEVCLGVNVWQHVWLRDYGFGGKKEFLERWWDSVDWKVVEDNAQLDAPGRGRERGMNQRMSAY